MKASPKTIGSVFCTDSLRQAVGRNGAWMMLAIGLPVEPSSFQNTEGPSHSPQKTMSAER
jgi:hypothetical protein